MSRSDANLRLLGIVGSLRRESHNRMVFGAARDLVPDGVELIEASLGRVPFYNADLESDGDPAPVAELKDAVRLADGLVFFTPEYNLGIPAVVKNAVDWLSRPYGDSTIAGVPCGVVAVTPGRRAAASVRRVLASTLGVTGGVVHEPTFGISSIRHRAEDGSLTDEDTVAELRSWLAEFAEFVRRDR